MQSAHDMRPAIVGKASRDAAFRTRLLADPKGVIGDELGVAMPEALVVQVHEEDGVTRHLVLPPSSRLSEADLRAVSGGRWVAQPGRDGVDAEDHTREADSIGDGSR